MRRDSRLLDDGAPRPRGAEPDFKRRRPNDEVDDLQDLQDCVTYTVDIPFRDVRKLERDPGAYLVRRMKNVEVSYSKLTPADREVFDNAKRVEISQFVAQHAVRICQDEAENQQAWSSGRIMKARWIMTWNTIPPDEQPQALRDRTRQVREGQALTINPSGTQKAKARIVIIGFQHPDLAKPELKTTSPVVGQKTKLLVLQVAAYHKWLLEGCDATTAFLQAEGLEEGNKIWTTGVPELVATLGASPGSALRILRSVSGPATAPRTFWLDVDSKLKVLGG